ncbi:iron chelate uptake ABC transporter family permease subunit [Shigella flexneri]
MSTLTRNPLADPGLLGVNAGAASLPLCWVRRCSVTSPRRGTTGAWPSPVPWLPAVAFTGSQGGGSHVRWVSTWRAWRWPAGAGRATSGIAPLILTLTINLRFWQAGSLDIRNLHTLKVVLIPVLIAGATALITEPRAEQVPASAATPRRRWAVAWRAHSRSVCWRLPCFVQVRWR